MPPPDLAVAAAATVAAWLSSGADPDTWNDHREAFLGEFHSGGRALDRAFRDASRGNPSMSARPPRNAPDGNT